MSIVNGREKDTVREQLTITTENAATLLAILLDRGYFHRKNATGGGCSPQILRSDDATEFRSPNDPERLPRYYSRDEALLVELNNNQSFAMLDTLHTIFRNELNRRGRWTISDAAQHLDIPATVLLRRIVVPLIVGPSFVHLKTSNGSIKEVVTEKYIHETACAVWEKLLLTPESGLLSIFELADSVFMLPLDVTLSILENRISSNGDDDSAAIRISRTDNGSKVLVTVSYLEMLQKNVLECFLSFRDTPADVAAIAKANGWDVGWVTKMVHDELQDALPGECRGETYIPAQYIHAKRRLVLDAFSANGFVTSHMCQTMFGILPSQMKEFVTLSTESLKTTCLVLEGSVISKDYILAPLVEAIQEATECAGFLDLSLHLPIELLEHETKDAVDLLELHVYKELNNYGGFTHIQSNGAIFFSQPMMASFTKTKLSELICDFAKTTASEMVGDEGNKQAEDIRRGDSMLAEENTHVSGKEKRKSRNAAKSKHHIEPAASQIKTTTTNNTIVPLESIVNLLLETYPDLSSTDVPACVLSEACDLAFRTSPFESLCIDALNAECELLRSESLSLYRNSCRPATSSTLFGFQSIPAAFEDSGCFASACFLVQAKAKFLSYAAECTDILSDKMIKDLHRDFLRGCCAAFTSRITQYAFFNHGIDPSLLSFGSREPFYSPIDLASSTNDQVYLACVPERVGRRNDPLALLREELPAGAGVALARQWALCGGECYEGGTKCDDGVTHTRPGDVDGFLAHVRENCLSICGIPFSALDKKTEKKFLNTRRVRLTQLLEEATDAETMLDLRIMLLYQLVKNVLVSGNFLRGPVLQLLTRERKVADSLSCDLLDVASRLEKCEGIDSELLERIKVCGASKVS